MDYRISRREVLNNLVRFKDHLSEMRERKQQRKLEEERKYRLLMNRRTGDIRFVQKINALEHHMDRRGAKKEDFKDWIEIQLAVHQKGAKGAARFEIQDTHNHTLEPKNMDPLAWEIASGTIDLLNCKAKEVKGLQEEMMAEEAILNDLSTIHVSSSKDSIQDLPGWMGALSRIDAEKILEKKPIGTYLLREGDEITEACTSHFAEENLLSIHPYLITVVEEDDKIVDILILETNQGWIHYNDDPNLKDPSYKYHQSAQGLLKTFSHIARYPLS